MPCSSCAAPLPAGAKFCPECGTRVAQPSEPAAAATTPSPPPPPIPAEASSSAPTRHERRLLTVLFADLVGFTAASDHADPEDVRARVRPFHALVREAVAATGGIVARVVGDGVMAVWGYPVAHEDDARRAVDAALRIRDGLPSAGDDLHARIGVNTGEAVVAFGSEEEDADDAMGDAVNVAARLASAAPPDAILVGEATRALSADHIAYEDLDPIRVKGKADPVPVARVTRRIAGRTEQAQGAFVGRRPEIERIVGHVVDAEAASRVHRVLVVGEPGIGKSRLLGEVRSRLGRDGRTWLVGRCRSDVSVPGLALGEVIKAWAGITDDDPPATAADRLERVVPQDAAERGWLIDRLRPLVGLEASGSASSEETFFAWTRALELLAGPGSAVIVIEDIHWADDELLLYLVSDALAGLAGRLTLLLTGRPEAVDRHAIGAVVDETIALAPLAGDALDALVSAVAAGSGLSPAERNEIIRRGGGNPLFSVQLVRLRAQQRAAGSGAGDELPETVQAVITARLDLLGTETRRVAQDASVVGAAFWAGALEAIRPRGHALSEALDELGRLELIRRRSESTLAGEPEYAFRHALVRDVAYGQLTRNDRASRHAAVGRWLGHVAGNRLDLAGVIADHDVQAMELFAASKVEPAAELREHAFGHLMNAGRHAEAIDPLAAAARYDQAAGLASDDRDRLQALFGAIRAREEAGAFAGELDAIATATRLAATMGDHLALGRLRIHESVAHRPLGNDRWVQDAQDGLEILEAQPPSVELVDALAQRSFIELATFEGTAAGVQHYATRAIELATALGVTPPAGAYARRGFSRAGDGDLGAFDDMRRAREIAERGSSGSALARVISDYGGVQVYFGEIEAAEEQVRQAIAVCRRRGLPSTLEWMVTNLAYTHRAIGRWDEAVALVTPSLAAPWPEEGVLTFIFRATELIYLLADRGDADGVRTLIDRMAASSVADQLLDELMGRARAVLGALVGEPELVVNGIAEVLTREADTDFDGRSATEYPNLARAMLSIQRPDLLDRFIASIAARSPLAQTTRELLVGYRAAGQADHEEAIRALGAAGEQLAAWGFAPEGAHARQWRGESEIALGLREEGLAHLTAARAVFERLRAAVPLARIDRVLAALAHVVP